MEKITRRSFMKGLAGTVGLGAVPSFGAITSTPKKQERTYAWSTAIEEEVIKENNLRNELSGLMKEYDIKIIYSEKSDMSKACLIDDKQLHKYIEKLDIPVEHLELMKDMLKEDVFKRGSYVRFIA